MGDTNIPSSKSNSDYTLKHDELSHLPVVAHAHQATVSQVYDPKPKPANPGPLGLLSFALTMFCVGLYQCGVGLPDSNPFGPIGPDQAVFGLAVFLGGGAQFIAGVMQFFVGNTFGMTVHCSYGAFWLAYAMFKIPSLDIAGGYNGDTRALTVAVGIFMCAWGLLALIFLVAALRTNLVIIVIFGLLALAFILLGSANFMITTSPDTAISVNQAGAAFAVIDAILAFYAGASGLMVPETTFIILPLGEISSPQVHQEKV